MSVEGQVASEEEDAGEADRNMREAIERMRARPQVLYNFLTDTLNVMGDLSVRLEQLKIREELQGQSEQKNMADTFGSLSVLRSMLMTKARAEDYIVRETPDEVRQRIVKQKAADREERERTRQNSVAAPYTVSNQTSFLRWVESQKSLAMAQV